MSEHPPMLPTLRDPRLDRALRESLAILREHTDDRDLRRAVQRVLDGEASLRELAGSDAFGALVAPLADRGWAHWEQLDGDEQARLAREGSDPRD